MDEIIQKDVENLVKEFGSSFSGKRILITGGAGFLGSWLCDVTVESGGKVDCLDNFSTSTNKNIEHLKGRMNLLTSNVEDASSSEKYDYIFDFSSRASPNEYIQHPIETLTASSIGTMKMLELAKKGNSVIVHACHDDKTRVLTQEGFKRHSEVKEGELVFTLNLETKTLELKPVVKVHSYEYKGRMIAFKGRRVDLLVTPNHKMLVETESYTWITKYEDARDVAKRSVFRFARAKQWQGKNIPLKLEGALEDIFYLVGLYIGDGYSDIHTGKAPNVTGYERKEYLQKCRDSNGRFTVPASRGKQQYTLMMSHRNLLYLPKTDKSRERVEACLDRLNIKWSSHSKYGWIYFGGEQWVGLFQQCGTDAHDKHVPGWMLGYEMPCLRSLLQGIIDSDGYIRNEQSELTVMTVSERLVRDISEIGLKLGLFVLFSKKQNEDVIEGRKISGDSFDVYVSNKNIMLGKAYPKSIHEEEYDGQVYCLEVQDNHNYVVERNGKVAFSGNSTSEIYGDPQVVPTPESYYGYTNSIGIRSCYDEGKRFAEALCTAYFRQYGVNVRMARIFNTYGPRIRADGLYGRALPRFILQALGGEPITIYGDGTQTRSFCYVTDIIRGILKLACVSGSGGLVANIGNPNEMTILDLAQKIITCTKSSSRLSFSPLMQDDPKRRCPDVSKAKEILGWKPVVSFEEGLARTIDWFESRSLE